MGQTGQTGQTNLTFLVACVGQLSQFLQSLIRRSPNYEYDFIFTYQNLTLAKLQLLTKSLFCGLLCPSLKLCYFRYISKLFKIDK